MGFLDSLFGPSVPSITAEELSQRLKVGKHPIVLDVRQPEEFRQMHIAGARLIAETQRELAARGVALRLVDAHAQVRDLVRKAVGPAVGEVSRRISIEDAVAAAREGGPAADPRAGVSTRPG